MKMKLLALILLASAFPLCAQTNPHVLVLFLQVDGDFDSAEEQMLKETLSIRLGEVSGEAFSVVPASATKPAADDLRTYVIASGATGYLDIHVSGNRLNVDINLQAFDVIENVELAHSSFKARFDRRMRVLLDFFWDPVIEYLASTIEPRDTRVTLVISAPPGSVITGDESEPVTIGPEGSTTTRLAAPAAYRFTASLPGHSPDTRRVFLERDGTELTLTPRPFKRWRVSSGLEWLAWPTLDLGFAPLAGRLFVHAGASTYALGITPAIDIRDEGAKLIDSYPVTTPFLGIDWYFTNPAIPIKAFLGLDGYLRLLHDSGVSIDSLLPAGARLRLGGELSIGSGFGLALAWVPQWFYSPDPSSFGLAMPRVDSEGYVVTPLGVFALPAFNLSVRWYP